MGTEQAQRAAPAVVGTGRPPLTTLPAEVRHKPATSMKMMGAERPGDVLGAKVESPVVARHEVPLGELELAHFEQLEAELPADRVSRPVLDARAWMHEV